MIYPVLRYHDGSYLTQNTAEKLGFHQAIQWLHQTAAKLPPLIQYRSFSRPGGGAYGALLTTAEPYDDRDGRNTPTKIMLILDGDAAAELMEDPRRIPALAACMRECLADPADVHEMAKLPDLSPWMEKKATVEVPSEETELIRRAVRSSMEGKHKVCYVTERWETLLAALLEMPVAHRCRTAFSIGWRKTEEADFFDVIVTDGDMAAVRPHIKRIWTKERHGSVREPFSAKQTKRFARRRVDRGVRTISDQPEQPELDRRPKRRSVRVGRILRVLLLMGAAVGFLLLNGSGYLSDLGRVYIQMTFDGNDLVSAVLLVLLGYLLGKLCCEVEVDEE